jgi:hypothetical protein
MTDQFIFKYIHNETNFTSSEFCNNKEIIVTLNGEQNLDQIFESFRGFLQSAGYVFDVEDRIDIVNDFDRKEDLLDDENDDEEEDSANNGWYMKPFTSEDSQEDSTAGFPVLTEDEDDSKEEFEDSSDEEAELEQLSDVGIDLRLLEEDSKEEKLSKLMEEVLPFLESLKKDPEKNYVVWPNRMEVIQEKIDAINNIVNN